MEHEKRKALADGLIDHVLDVSAKAVAHLIRDVVKEVVGKVRSSTAEGVPMTDADAHAFVETRLKELIREDEARVRGGKGVDSAADETGKGGGNPADDSGDKAKKAKKAKS